MEVSFLKDAIDRIAEMARPFVMEVDGRKYCSANMREVEGQGEKPETYQVDTLDALIQLVRTEGTKTYERLYVRVKDPRTVVVDSGYIATSQEFYDRASLYQAVTDVPSITYGRAMVAERAVIELQSLYEATGDRDYLLALLSHIDTSQGVSTMDNGVTQEVSVRRGVALKEQQTVQPIVHLQPYRTFLEVAQPASDFLLRVDNGGCPALYEADGGAWKLEAKRNIAGYLSAQLADLEESGNVVVMI